MGTGRILLVSLAGVQLFGCVLIDWIPIRYEPLPPPARTKSVIQEKLSPSPVEPLKPNLRKPPSSPSVTKEKKSPAEPRKAPRREAGSASIPEGPGKEDRRLAEAEDPEKQYSLGRLYFHGEEVEGDYVTALDFFLAAAQQGHPGALRALGHMYENGLGTLSDPDQASKWYALAAGHGDVRAMSALGYLVFTGYGIPQDTEVGLRWLRMAGEQGNVEAQLLLGAIYDSGWSVPEDDKEALNWYARAAEGGDPLARFMQGCMHALGKSTPLDLVSAAKNYRMAADSGLAEAQALLGNRYVNLSGEESGLRWKQSLIEEKPRYAREHLQKFSRMVETYKGAVLGDGDAMFRIGSFYWRGDGFERDFDQAVKWWRFAAKLGNGKARGLLAQIDEFVRNGASGEGMTMTRVGNKSLPTEMVYEIGFDLLKAGRHSGEIRPSPAWMNMLRRSRELSSRP